MTRKATLGIVAVLAGSLLMASASSAATIFNVNFDGDSGTPDVASPAAASPTVNTKPTAYDDQSGSSVVVQNGTTATEFDSFGGNDFLVYAANPPAGASRTASTVYELNTADQSDTGVVKLNFDLQYNDKGPNASGTMQGTFGAYFYSGGTSIGLFSVSLKSGIMRIWRTTDGGAISANVTNMTLSPDTQYTVTGILKLNGASSTLDFEVTPKGGTTVSLVNGQSSNVKNVTFTTVKLNNLGSDANSLVAVDNVKIDVVPEPASLGLLGIGAAGMLMRRHRGQ